MIEIKTISVIILLVICFVLWFGYIGEKSFNNDWGSQKTLLLLTLPIWFPAVLVLLFL